jgi:hypothetical protein
MSLTFSTLMIEFEEKRITLGIAELGNAILALFWEGEDPKWGSTTLTLPDSTSTQILGDRDTMLGRVIGIYLAKRFGKMVLVSTQLSQGYGKDLGLTLLKMTKQLTEKNKKND